MSSWRLYAAFCCGGAALMTACCAGIIAGESSFSPSSRFSLSDVSAVASTVLMLGCMWFACRHGAKTGSGV
jgi:hypothetical protein